MPWFTRQQKQRVHAAPVIIHLVPHYVTLMRWTSQGVAGLPAWRERVEDGERTIAEAGREEEFGAVRYRTTPLFERVFGLESLAALPRLDDLGGEADEIRARLEAVAEKRPA